MTTTSCPIKARWFRRRLRGEKEGNEDSSTCQGAIDLPTLSIEVFQLDSYRESAGTVCSHWSVIPMDVVRIKIMN
jgi:hypothetical protein